MLRAVLTLTRASTSSNPCASPLASSLPYPAGSAALCSARQPRPNFRAANARAHLLALRLMRDALTHRLDRRPRDHHAIVGAQPRRRHHERPALAVVCASPGAAVFSQSSCAERRRLSSWLAATPPETTRVLGAAAFAILILIALPSSSSSCLAELERVLHGLLEMREGAVSWKEAATSAWSQASVPLPASSDAFCTATLTAVFKPANEKSRFFLFCIGIGSRRSLGERRSSPVCYCRFWRASPRRGRRRRPQAAF